MEKIIKQKNHIGKFLIYLFIVMVVVLVYKLVSEVIEIEWKEVNKNHQYSYIDVQYLIGPVAEKILDNNEKTEYYLVENDGKIVGCILMKQNFKTVIPKISLNEQEHTTVGHPQERIYGYSEAFNSEISYDIIKRINEDFRKNEVNASNFQNYIGQYYLNTTVSYKDENIRFITMIWGALLIFCVIETIILKSLDNKDLKKEIKKMKKDGTYDIYENDIESSNTFISKKYYTIVANVNIYNFEQNYIIVIPIKEIKDIYKSSKLDQPLPTKDFEYICIEMNDNEIYRIAVKLKNDEEFEKLFNQIKQRIEK